MDLSDNDSVDVLVIGAGLSGVLAASELVKAGKRVLMVEKGRGVGGRMTGRRFGGAAFDHGAQFVTARTPRFLETMNEWSRLGVAREWCRGFNPLADGNPRWCGVPAMSALAKHAAQGIALRLETQVSALSLEGSSWCATLKTGGMIRARAVVMTVPVPQALAILSAGSYIMDPKLRSGLEEVEYERCLAVMAILEASSRVPPPGGLSIDEGPIAWIADNQQKGLSTVPCVTIHASPGYSLQHWEDERQSAGVPLLEAAIPWIGTGVKEYQVHGWRYSKPIQTWAEPCAVVQASPALILAGDAFGGPRVEGAALSGWAAAEALLAIPG